MWKQSIDVGRVGSWKKDRSLDEEIMLIMFEAGLSFQQEFRGVTKKKGCEQKQFGLIDLLR